MPSVRFVSGILAVTLLVAWSAPPASADTAKAISSKAPLAKSVAAKVAALKPYPRAFQTQTTPAGGADSRSFLKTPMGIIAVVATVAGLGYAVRSAFKDNDAVHSPVR